MLETEYQAFDIQIGGALAELNKLVRDGASPAWPNDLQARLNVYFQARHDCITNSGDRIALIMAASKALTRLRPFIAKIDPITEYQEFFKDLPPSEKD